MNSVPQELEVRCTCAGCCTIVKADRFSFDDGETFVEFFTRASSHAPLGYRLRLMWRIFRRHEHYLDCVLLDADGAERLGAFLLAKPEPTKEAA